MAAADHDTAASVADCAGRLLLELRQVASGEPDLGDRADRLAHTFIIDELSKTYPADAIRSEEGVAGPSRMEADRVWIVDPLDGTREYREGRTDWAVHVALVAGGDLVVGSVALPAKAMLFSTPSPPAAPARGHGRLRITVSRTRPPPFIADVQSRLDADLVPMGSAGAKAMAVLTGEVDGYLHAGGQHEWDSAAPVAVAQAAGLHASRLDGSPLRYNQDSPWLPDLVVCRPEIASALLAALR